MLYFYYHYFRFKCQITVESFKSFGCTEQFRPLQLPLLIQAYSLRQVKILQHLPTEKIITTVKFNRGYDNSMKKGRKIRLECF